MARLIIGSLVAAIVMFIIGFGFYATPLGSIAYASAEPAVVAQVQAALGELPASGAYAIPDPAAPDAEAAYARGPIGLVKLVKGGFPLFDPVVLVMGLVHYFVSALLIGLALLAIADRLDFGRRLALIGWMVLGTSVFHQLSDPIWYRQDWTYALFVFVANTVIIASGAVVLARWFVPTGDSAAGAR